jgi:hypothetical protein
MDFYSAVPQLSERSKPRKIKKKFIFIQQHHNYLRALNHGKLKKKMDFYSAVPQLSECS